MGCLFGLGGIGYWVERTQWKEQSIAQNNHKSSNEAAIIRDNSVNKKSNNGISGNNAPHVDQTFITPKTQQNTAKYLSKQVFPSENNTFSQNGSIASSIGQSPNTLLANGTQNMPIASSTPLLQGVESGTPLSQLLVENVDAYSTNTNLMSATTALKTAHADKEQPLSVIGLPFKISTLEKNKITPIMASKPISNTKSKHLEIYAGSGVFSTQQRFSTQDNMKKDYAALRNETETDLATFAFDAGINYWFSDKNFIAIGVQHNRWYDRLNYTYKQPKDYTYENILLRIVKNEQLGTQEGQYGDTVITGTEIVKMTHYNRYVSSNLRLLLGRQIWSRKRLSLDLAGGMDWSVFATAKGNIAAPISTGGIFDLQNTGGNTMYKKSLGIGLSGTMSVNYRLNQHWAIQFRPSATYFLSDAARANAFTEARFYRFGAMLGLRYRL